MLTAPDQSRVSGDFDFGPQTHEFLGMHEAIFKNGLRDQAGPLGHAHQGHELGLHVCGKSGIGLGGDIDAPDVSIGLNPQAVRIAALGYIHPHFPQFVNHGVHGPDRTVAEGQGTVGDRCGNAVGAGLYAVRQNCVAAGMQAGNALNFQDAGALAFNPGPAGIEKVGQVLNFRFPGGIFQDGFSFG